MIMVNADRLPGSSARIDGLTKFVIEKSKGFCLEIEAIKIDRKSQWTLIENLIEVDLKDQLGLCFESGLLELLDRTAG